MMDDGCQSVAKDGAGLESTDKTGRFPSPSLMTRDMTRYLVVLTYNNSDEAQNGKDVPYLPLTDVVSGTPNILLRTCSILRTIPLQSTEDFCDVIIGLTFSTSFAKPA
jgi:hypothetical protein